MTNVVAVKTLKELAGAVTERLEGKLHSWVYAEIDGESAIVCLWSEPGAGTKKEVIGEAGLGLSSEEMLCFVRAINKSMKATHLVVSMLVDLYKSHNGGQEVGANILY